jgi:hypothetical protein
MSLMVLRHFVNLSFSQKFSGFVQLGMLSSAGVCPNQGWAQRSVGSAKYYYFVCYIWVGELLVEEMTGGQN